ncbi:MAG: hypothetical protein WBZ36_11650 [Candidatus Nitrosopolaris sp.]
MSRRKQPPPGPRTPSQAQLEKSLERYTCTLDKSTSEQARLLGLERGQTVCQVTGQAVRDFIRRARESENS